GSPSSSRSSTRTRWRRSIPTRSAPENRSRASGRCCPRLPQPRRPRWPPGCAAKGRNETTAVQACSFPRGGTVAAPRRSREGLRIAHAPALRLAFAVSVLSASALACNDTEVDDRHRTPPAAPTTPTPPPQPEPEAPPVRKDG